MLVQKVKKPIPQDFGFNNFQYALQKQTDEENEKQKSKIEEKVDRFQLPFAVGLLIVSVTIIKISSINVYEYNLWNFVKELFPIILICFLTFIPVAISHWVSGLILRVIFRPKKEVRLVSIDKIIQYEWEIEKYNKYLFEIKSKFEGIDLFNYDLSKFSEEIFEEILEKEVEVVSKVKEIIEFNKDLNYWKSLDGYKFEEEVAKLYQEFGYETKVTKKSGDGGIDIIMKNKSGEKIFVQCKNHANPVPVNVARELLGVMTAHGVKKGILVCSNGITKEGHELTKKNSIELVTNNQLVTMSKVINSRLSNDLIFDKSTKYSIYKNDDISLFTGNGFLKWGLIYLYKDIFETEKEVRNLIDENQIPGTNYLSQIKKHKGVHYLIIIPSAHKTLFQISEKQSKSPNTSRNKKWHKRRRWY